MKAILVLVVLFAISQALPSVNYRQQFVQFQRKYHKVYSHDEFQKRFAIFQENMKEAERLNQLNPLAKFGPTKFSDLTKQEFAKYYLMPNYTRQNPRPEKVKFTVPNKTTFDWASPSIQPPVISAVKDQGQCGSCWAFSATETIESQYAQENNVAPAILAPEQIVDCDVNGQDEGCNGGFPTGAYQYVQSAGGMDSEQSYPYTAGQSGQGGNCQASQNTVVPGTNVANYKSVSGESGLYQHTSTKGPVSVCVDASSWQNYQGGVLTSCGDNIDHCVQLTGYNGYNSGNAYWIVRNSWNTDWGINGFIWIQIGQDLCAIGDEATVVTTSN